MDEFDFLRHEKLTDRLSVVRESFGPCLTFNIYVVIGDHNVAVVDSGLGATGGLRRYIETYITRKAPMVCYMTHVHLDHFGGAILFDEAYLNHREYHRVPWDLNVERRFSDLAKFCGGNQEILDFCREHYLQNENVKYKDVVDGDVVDLGGVTLQAIELPGHSAGSVAYYNREENYALVGDAIQYFGSFIRCRDFAEALRCLNRFIAMMPEDIVLYNGHEPVHRTLAMANDLRTAFEDLLAGRTEGDEPFPAQFAYLPPEDKFMKRMSHKVGSVMVPYDANVLEQRAKESRA
jgi:hydroxyacylglutathione hydrolase